ncbi:MAG TPA: antitoxin [Chloroflexota bacterium]|nr:antitoxin [Chloroflexota bacterium]
MRTTIDLPADVHELARSIARGTSRSLSETIVDLVRRGLRDIAAQGVSRSERTGLPVVRLGAPITSEDVRALEDDAQVVSFDRGLAALYGDAVRPIPTA